AGELSSAFKHLDWAETFAPGNSEHQYLRVCLLIASGESERAVQMGRELLQGHPGMDHLRTLLAQTIAFRESASRADREEAIRLLQHLTETNTADVDVRLLALALAASIQQGLGHEAEYRRLLNTFDQLAKG